MTDQGKPRICQVLGVEVDEDWHATGSDMATYRINEDGEFEYAMPLYSRPGHGEWRDSDLAHLLNFISHPDRIIHKPCFTSEEVAVIKYIDRCHKIKEIRRSKDGLLEVMFETEGLWALPNGMFSSIRPGQAVTIADIIRQNESRPG